MPEPSIMLIIQQAGRGGGGGGVVSKGNLLCLLPHDGSRPTHVPCLWLRSRSRRFRGHGKDNGNCY